MGKMESVFRSEVGRLARRELRQLCAPVTRDVRRMKHVVARLNRAVAALERAGREWSARAAAVQPKLQASEDELRGSRLSPRLIQTLRKKLNISQAELAALVGVSTVAVWCWESGRTKPTGENRSAIVALRKLGRREVKGRLAQKAAAKADAAPAKPKGRKARKARKARRKKA